MKQKQTDDKLQDAPSAFCLLTWKQPKYQFIHSTAAETTLIMVLAETAFHLHSFTYQAILSVSMQNLLIDDTSVVP